MTMNATRIARTGRSTRVLAAAALLLAFPLAGNAVEFVDGDNEPVTVLNNMHACPPGFVVSGVHVDSNLLLCTGYFGYLLDPPVLVRGISASTPIPDVAPFPFDGTSMHWCGPGRMVRGVHVAGNRFTCQSFDRITTQEMGPLGPPFLDRGNARTVRAGMHACPVGSVLVGAHFVSNTFLCAALPLCADNAQCVAGTRCIARTPNSLFKTCRSR
jgi:hypothetical protein